jgi:hypothetical protein
MSVILHFLQRAYAEYLDTISSAGLPPAIGAETDRQGDDPGSAQEERILFVPWWF